MKQIFDWLREQIDKYSYDTETCGGRYIDIIEEKHAIKLVDEAEAKWEEEHKPYNVEKVVEQIHDYFCKVIDKQKGDTIPLEILEYNKAICEIVRKGEVE